MGREGWLFPSRASRARALFGRTTRGRKAGEDRGGTRRNGWKEGWKNGKKQERNLGGKEWKERSMFIRERSRSCIVSE